MTNTFSQEHELKLSEQFSRGERTGHDEQENQAFKIYGAIGEQIRSYTVPEIDTAALSSQLANRMAGRSSLIERWNCLLNNIPTPAFATVCVICILFVLLGLGIIVQRTDSVAKIEFLSQSGEGIPFLWEKRLRMGRLVTIPEECTANLDLTDGSTILCSPKSQIAVQSRRITLNSGSITVRATQVPGSTMTVETPMGTVSVVGTVFRVEVVR
ncbi:MAG: FecR family protein [bacterium]